jgi:hypothetical protein
MTDHRPLQTIGALSAASCAVRFCAQPETWPLFMEFLKANGMPNALEGSLSRELTMQYAKLLHEAAAKLAVQTGLAL